MRVPVVAHLRDGLNKNLGEILNVMKMRCGEKLCHCKVWQPCVEQLHTLSFGHSQSQRTEQVPDCVPRVQIRQICVEQTKPHGNAGGVFPALGFAARFRKFFQQ